MNTSKLILLFLLTSLVQSVAAESLPAKDERASTVRTLNTPRQFPVVANRLEWQNRAKAIREGVLVSCGLWPMPEKTPLQPQTLGRIERDDYTIEKIAIQTSLAAFAQNYSKGRRVVLCGTGRAGLWTLLAAPAVDAVVADCDRIDPADDQLLLSRNLFVPGIRRIYGFEGAASLASPRPAFLHNTGDRFETTLLTNAYRSQRAVDALRVERSRIDDNALVVWISQLQLP